VWKKNGKGFALHVLQPHTQPPVLHTIEDYLLLTI